MALCHICQGTGQVDASSHDPCYSCGGRGSDCTACGGTGVSARPRRETCWLCGGSGREADAATSQAGRGRRDGKHAAIRTSSQRARPWTKDERIILLPAYAGSCWGLIEFAQISGWPAFLFAAIPALLIARFWKGILTFGLLGAGVWLLAKSGI